MPIVQTTHIQKLMEEALSLAADCDRAQLFIGSEQPTENGKPSSITLRKLERAVNLCRHAAAELEDEYLRARDGWPVV